MITVRNLTKQTVPSLPLQPIAEAVLGRDYELSLVFCGEAKSRALNRRFRHKTTAANVLAFPLDQQAGEIFINVHKLAPEAKKWQVTKTTRLRHLFIHALLHLKGLDHGSKMDKQEQQLLARWSNEKYYYRSRSRYRVDSRRRR